MRLIDADAFKKVLSEHETKHDKRSCFFDDYDCGAANAYEHASDLLDDMPTVTIPVSELDTFVLGYKQAIADCRKRLEKSVAHEIEKPIIEGDKKTYWDFQRDYHGRFKKKEDKHDGA